MIMADDDFLLGHGLVLEFITKQRVREAIRFYIEKYINMCI